MPAASTSERRRVPVRYGLALVAAVAVALSLLTPTQPAHAVTAPKGKVVLDPDDDYSHAVWGGTTYTELPITYAIARAAKAKLESLCDTSVVISRDASQNFVPQAQRAALMQGAEVSLTISLNGLNGSPWGTAADGGAQAWATSFANNLAFGQQTLDEWRRFTGGPNAGRVNQGATYPYPEFAGLPGTYAQTFFGCLDHNFDWPAISATFEGARYGYVTPRKGSRRPSTRLGKVTKRGYDAPQNLASVTDPADAATRIASDAADRLTHRDRPARRHNHLRLRRGRPDHVRHGHVEPRDQLHL